MRRYATAALLVACGLLAGLLLVEAGFRIAGYRPKPDGGYHTAGWAMQDPVLGWRCRPGVWPVDCEQRPMTILEDGTRLVTGAAGAASGPVVLLVGCSYAAGYGVADEEGMASRLQAQLSGARVINFATPGYGTYQSYLAVRQWLDRPGAPRPDIVLYGYAAHHPIRNVADWNWLASLRSYSGTQLVPPHLERGADGTWVEAPPVEHDLLGLASRSDLVFFVQSRLLARRYGPKPPDEHRAATCQALSLLQELCDGRGVRLVVANIFNNREDDCALAAYCREHGIDYRKPALDVAWRDPDYFLCRGVGSGHPNERYHDALGRELAAMLRPALGPRR